MTSKLIEEVEKLRPKPGDTGYLAGSARVADVVDQVIALLRQHGEQRTVEARISEREAVEAMARAHQDCPEAPIPALSWDELPEGHPGSSRPTCRCFLRVRMGHALAADPLRRRLGPVAMQAIVEGKAAVVPVWKGEHGTYLGKPPGWGLKVGNCDLDDIRLDKRQEER